MFGMKRRWILTACGFVRETLARGMLGGCERDAGRSVRREIEKGLSEFVVLNVCKFGRPVEALIITVGK